MGVLLIFLDAYGLLLLMLIMLESLTVTLSIVDSVASLAMIVIEV